MSFKDEVERILRSRPRRKAAANASAQEQLEVLVDNHHEAILELQQALVKLAEDLDAASAPAPDAPAEAGEAGGV